MIPHARPRYRCLALVPLVVAGERIDPEAEDSSFTADYGTALDLIRAGRAMPGDELAERIGGHFDEAMQRWVIPRHDGASQAIRRAIWIECPPPFA